MGLQNYVPLSCVFFLNNNARLTALNHYKMSIVIIGSFITH